MSNRVGSSWHLREKCKIAPFLGSVITHTRWLFMRQKCRKLAVEVEPLACRSCFGVPGASDGHVLSSVTQQKATWLDLNPFSFQLWHGLVLLLNVCSGVLGFAVLPQSWSVLWGAVKGAETWCRVHQGAETWLCLTPCWKSSEILKLSILSSRYFPASCHLYAHSTYRSILKDWNVGTYSLSISRKRNSRIMHWCMTVEQN